MNESKEKRILLFLRMVGALLAFAAIPLGTIGAVNSDRLLIAVAVCCYLGGMSLLFYANRRQHGKKWLNKQFKKQDLKKAIVGIIVIVLICAIMGISDGCESDAGGDGKSSCKICGRSSVFAYGYCEDCFNDYMDWREENGYTK